MRKLRFSPEFFECKQKTSLQGVPLMEHEFSSLLGNGEIDMKEIEYIHRVFEECLGNINLRVNLNEEIGSVIEEVPCIVEKWGGLSSRVEEESFRNIN